MKDIGPPEFQSHKERDAYFRDHAEYFTVVKKEGVGNYSREELKTLEQAEAVAKLKQTLGGGNYMIYAVIGEQSAFVKAVPQPNGQEATNGKTVKHSDTPLRPVKKL